MQELKTAVIASFDRLAQSGALEATLDESLKKCVTDAINNHLRSYSEFGQQVNEAVKAALQVDLRQLSLPSYGHLVLKIVEAQVEKQASDSIARHVQQQLSELLKPAPIEMKLSALVADFLAHCKRYHDLHPGDSITLLVEKASTYGSRWVRMDQEAGKEKHSCRVSFLVMDDGSIGALSLGGAKAESVFFAGRIYGFERSMFQLYTAGTKLIVDGDEDSIEITLPYND